MKKPKKVVLLDRLVSESWFASEREALPWIMARKVLVSDKPATSLKEKVAPDSVIRVREYYKKRYVNKGGLKLEGALKDFGVDVNGKVALDCGASTGGFTDCLITHGAKKVYAVDAGNGQLAGKLATNAAVVNMERTNLGDPVLLTLDPVPEVISLDLSYLSLVKALPLCRDIFQGGAGTAICLVKPIYEVESAEIRRTGKINDLSTLRDVLSGLCAQFTQAGFAVCGITFSPVTGNNGTLEYFILVRMGGGEVSLAPAQMSEQIELAIERSFTIDKFEKDRFAQSGGSGPLEGGTKIPAPDEKKYATRSGLKLEKALGVFSVDPSGKVCIDIGASEGGFTDCLLQHSAARVYSVDVAYGILNWRLRSDERVVVLERMNARYLTDEHVKEKCDLVTMDVSFISITKILPAVKSLMKPDAQIVSLFKPQFEVAKAHIQKHGNIEDPQHVIDCLAAVIGELRSQGVFMRALTYSPISGNHGNIEFLLHGDINPANDTTLASESLDQIVREAYGKLFKPAPSN